MHTTTAHPFTCFRRKFLMTLPLLGQLLLTACGGGGSGGTTFTPSSPSPVTPTPPVPQTPPPPPPVTALPSGGMINTSVLSQSQLMATIELQMVIVDSDSNVISNLSAADISLSDFTDDSGVSLQFQLNQVTLEPMNYAGPYSAFMLMDQSGSITSTDPQDARIEAAKIFLGNMDPADNARLAAFADNGALSHSPVTAYGSLFTSDGSSFFGALDHLASKEGGGTPLYDAIYGVTNVTASEAPNPNKAVIVFTDGNDTASQKASIDDVINNANANGVKLFTVGLSNGVDTAVLSRMAMETGGAFIQAGDARQLVSWYGTLGRILNGTASFYRAQFSVTADQTSFVPGATLRHTVKVNTPQGTLSVPFRIEF